MKMLLAVWKRVKVLLIALMHGFGALLIVLALFNMLRICVYLLWSGPLVLGRVKFGAPGLTIDTFRLDGSTWTGASILILFNLFLLAWGWDFVSGGRSKRPISPRGRANRALAALRLKLLFNTLLRRTKD